MNERFPGDEPPGRIDPTAVLCWTLTAAALATGTPLAILLWDIVAGL